MERQQFPTEQYMWGDTVFTVDEAGTDGTWRSGETVDITTTVGAGNIWRPFGSTVGVRLRVTGLRSTTGSTAVRAARLHNGHADPPGQGLRLRPGLRPAP